MEKDIEVWKQMFQELIQEVKPWDRWTLTLDKRLLPNDLKPGWLQYQQRTFARFQCSSCSRSWASANILVLFHMHWYKKKRRGQVKMRVFAQRCKKCLQPPFEVPEFTKDNITRVLNNLVFKILKKCYREGFKQVEEIPAIGDVCLEGPHDSHNCEACLQGFCTQSGSGLPSKSPVSPVSPTPSQLPEAPKVTGINLPCSPPPTKKVDKPQASRVKPKVHNTTKADPHITAQCYTPKSLTVLTLTSQLPQGSSYTPKPSSIISLTPELSINPQTSKLSSITSHTPQPSPITSPTSEVSRSSCTSKPSPTSSCTSKLSSRSSPTLHPSPTSSRTLRWVTQMPSPTKSSMAVNAATSGTRREAGRTSSSNSSCSYAVPPAWRPPAHSIYQVEEHAETRPRSECIHHGTCCSCVPQNLSSCCCLILIFVGIIVWLLVKYT